MRWSRLVPIFIGIAIFLFGIYLVSTNGYVGSTYLPSIIGIHPCSTNSTGSFPSGACSFSYLGYGVGTIVCIFGLGLIASSARRYATSAGSGSNAMSPEMVAAIAQAQSRLATASAPAAPGAKPGTVYCSNCGAANPSQAKFCHQCATAIGGAAPPQPTPSLPPGGTG